MAIISVTPTDAGMISQWKRPAGKRLEASRVPVGLKTYTGTQAIASLLAGNQTSFRLTMNFTEPFTFQLKDLAIWWQTDDSATDPDLSTEGLFNYLFSSPPGGNFPLDRQPAFLLQGSLAFRGATLLPTVAYAPVAPIRPLIRGGIGSLARIDLNDSSADATAAGDVVWAVNFYMYDVEQTLHYAVNEAITTLSV